MPHREQSASLCSTVGPVAFLWLALGTVTAVVTAAICRPDAAVSLAALHPSGWSVAGSMRTSHYNGTLTALPNGKALVAGGAGPNGADAGAALFDPATGRWAKTASMRQRRSLQTATLLQSGKVLITGGFGTGNRVLASVEIYDPRRDIWSVAQPMHVARAGHSAVLLPSGLVLVTGGLTNSGLVTSSAELYSPVTNVWTIARPMRVPRYDQSSVVLPDGDVLVTGGTDGQQALFSAELYDTSRHQWLAAAAMHDARRQSPAILLRTGSVLVVGAPQLVSSCVYITACPFYSAELYYPATKTWQPTAAMTTPRGGDAAVLLLNGTVLDIGGSCSGPATAACGDILNSTEIYDPRTSRWHAGPSLKAARFNPLVARLRDGTVLVAGGSGYNTGKTGQVLLASTELLRLD